MDQFEQAARNNIERHIGDVCTGDDDIDDIRNEAWNLAHDGAVDAGANHNRACEIAWAVTEELY